MNNEKLKLSTFIRINQGFSLLEVIVALAVLLLIIIAFTTLFTFSFGGIFSQGRKSEALYEDVQKELEEKYDQGNPGSSDTLFIDFGDSSINLNRPGMIIVEQYTYEDQTGAIYTFIPDDQ